MEPVRKPAELLERARKLSLSPVDAFSGSL
jgi:hypothetical protein